MIDAILLGLLAIADLGLVAHLRQRRRVDHGNSRVLSSMAFAIRREIEESPMTAPDLLVKAG